MSNQRAGKTHKAAATTALSDANARALVTFFKSAKEVLTQYEEEDAAFYFEQVEEHLRRGGSLTDPIGKILGV